MFDMQSYTCPGCGLPIREQLSEDRPFTCGGCEKEFQVMLEPQGGKAALIELNERPEIPPLYMPKGSIRALVSLAMIGSCWLMVVLDRPLPSTLMSLILAVIGYYFGFRTRAKAADSRMLDPSAQPSRLLNMPGGMIRVIMICGFAASAVILARRGAFVSHAYVEFFIILAGLIFGHLIGRALAQLQGTELHTNIGHAAGLAVLIVAAYLSYLFVSGAHATSPPLLVSILCAGVSFYFGSRS